MLDQNTTTIITTVITVIGTLGGAFGGIFLSSRYSTKLEKLRIEEQKAQERSKRNTAVIEEVYTLLTKVANQASKNIANHRLLTEETSDDIGRIRTLIHLYIPSAKGKYLSFIQAFYGLSTELNSIDDDKKKDWETAISNLPTPFGNYFAEFRSIHNLLENLVK